MYPTLYIILTKRLLRDIYDSNDKSYDLNDKSYDLNDKSLRDNEKILILNFNLI